ncbi:MAG: hypothetical protein LBD97_07605 [Bifidobacteriaceae bacterium]|nr:hypothetical protein [Bifidobacteriaceae bacterium]
MARVPTVHSRGSVRRRAWPPPTATDAATSPRVADPALAAPGVLPEQQGSDVGGGVSDPVTAVAQGDQAPLLLFVLGGLWRVVVA